VQRVDGGWRAWICCHPLDELDEIELRAPVFKVYGEELDPDWLGTPMFFASLKV
jgi:hypothetical protein